MVEEKLSEYVIVRLKRLLRQRLANLAEKKKTTITALTDEAVEKFLENPDVEQFITIDTVNLKSKNIQVKVENFSDYKTLNLFLDKKLVKKWRFKIYSKLKSNTCIRF